MTEAWQNVHPRFSEFDQSWEYSYVRGWAGTTHQFMKMGEYGPLQVSIYDPFDHEERNDIYEIAWRIGHKPGSLLYEHWYVDVGIETGYTKTWFDIEDLQGMIDELKHWQYICDSHNEVNKNFAQVVDY